MKVAVVGAGIHGASAARNLAERRHRVTLFEQFSPGHTMGSSHGESRIVRKAYPDAFYTGLMAEGYPLWRDLELASGETLLHEVGLAYFGKQDSANLRTMTDGLSAVGEPFDVLDATRIRAFLPQLRLTPDEIAVFTRAAGWVDASKCVAASLGLASRSGCEIVPSHRVEREQLEREFDAYVVAPGAWIRDWVPDLDVRVTMQTVAFYDADIEGSVWIEDDALAYGFPSHGSFGAKVAFHVPEQPFEPTTDDRIPNPSRVEKLGKILERRFGIDHPDLKRAYGCLYTNTPDEDFRIGKLGSSGFYVSACSGHGFKFGPWIGRLMADLVEGRCSADDYPRFTRH